MLLGIAMPAGLLVLFASLSENIQLAQFSVQSLAPGIIVFSFSFLTMFSGILLAKDRDSAFLTRLLASPLKPVDFILAYCLPFIPIAFVQILICFVTARFLGFSSDLTHFLISLIILIPAALACIAIGLILGSLLTEKQVGGVASFVIIASSLFSGAWMDLNMVGGVFKNIGYALPFAYAVDAARAIFEGTKIADLADNFYWIFGYTLLFLFIGILSFRFKTKK